MNELNEFWKKNFDTCPPYADELKHLFKAKWVRFHALPESKRYPDTEQEYQEIFYRHNQVLSDLTRYSREVHLILTAYNSSVFPAYDFELVKRMIEPKHWLTIPVHEPECEPRHYLFAHLYVEKLFWKKDILNDIFRQVADEILHNVMIVNVEEDWLFHPYDGGTDVILKTSHEMKILKNKYSNWLSKRPDGY